MSVVVQASARFLNRLKPEEVSGFVMMQALRLAKDSKSLDATQKAQRALRAVLRHSNFSSIRCDANIQTFVMDFLDTRLPVVSAVAFVASLERLLQEKRGWDPLTLPECRALESDTETHDLLCTAIGMVALIWQATEYPDHIVVNRKGSYTTLP